MMMMIWQKCTFSSDQYGQMDFSEEMRSGSKSEPVSPVGSLSRPHKLQRAFSSIMGSSRQSSILSSSSSSENIDQLEMLLEAYFVVIDNTLSKLSSLKEYIDDTEDLINIKLGEQNTWICSLGCSSCQQGNVHNQMIQFELLLTATTFVATIFAVVTEIFGMFHCVGLYISFLYYFWHKKVFPL